MKKGFEEPNAIPPGKTIKSPFNFDCPPYDERSSCYINAGSHYGVGKTQPIGHINDPQVNVAALPSGKVNTMKVSEIPLKNLDLDIIK